MNSRQNISGRRNKTGLATQPSPATILHVHDGRRGSHRTCRSALERRGFKVESVTDGAEVCEAVRTKPFSLIFTENETPEMSGVALARRLRLEGVTLPIIMATCCATALLDQDLSSLEFAAVLVKPFRVADLLGAVKRALRGNGNKATPV